MRTLPWLLVLSYAVIFMGAFIASAFDETDCYTSDWGDKCGTDLVRSSQQCGGETCVTDEDVFDHMIDCGTASTGSMECIKITPCQKHHITRECIQVDETWTCQFIKDTTSDIRDNHLSSGSACVNGNAV